MFQLLGRLKYNLSNITDEAWHYKVVKSIFRNPEDGKSCTYYWFKLPGALIAWAITVIIAILIWAIGFFFGNIPKFNDETEMFYPHKKLPNGRRIPFSVFEVILVVTIVYGVYYLARINQELGVMVALLVGGLALLIITFAVLFFVLTKSWKNPAIVKRREAVKAAWNRACPTLNVEHISKN